MFVPVISFHLIAVQVQGGVACSNAAVPADSSQNPREALLRLGEVHRGTVVHAFKKYFEHLLCAVNDTRH